MGSCLPPRWESSEAFCQHSVLHGYGSSLHSARHETNDDIVANYIRPALILLKRCQAVHLLGVNTSRMAQTTDRRLLDHVQSGSNPKVRVADHKLRIVASAGNVMRRL